MSALDDLLHKKPQDLSDLQTVVINSVLGIASTAMAEAAAAQLAQMQDEIAALKAENTLREQATRTALDECAAKDELLDSRAGKLLKKRKFFLVVACDEPYFKMVYDQIKLEELLKGTWTKQDEETMSRELAKVV